jgi:DNA-binding transcriptional LysR family regulator
MRLASPESSFASHSPLGQICFQNHNDKVGLEMRSLNLDQLRTLTEVVTCGSFSAAARRLNLTQPAVSLQIRELEARIGVRLVERFGKQAHATEPGRKLVQAAQRLLEDCNVIEREMRHYRQDWLGQARLGTTLTSLTYRLPPILGRLRERHPGIELTVSNMPTQDSVANILQNKIDLALVILPVESRKLRITKLCEETMVAIFPPRSQDVPAEITPDYAARQTVLIEHLRSSAHPLVLDWLGKERLPRNPIPIGTVEALKTAVASNLGMAIVPEVAVAKHRSDFIVRSLRPPLLRTLALIEHRNKVNDPALEVVRNELLALRLGDAKPAAGDAGDAKSSGTHKRRSRTSEQVADVPSRRRSADHRKS